MYLEDGSLETAYGRSLASRHTLGGHERRLYIPNATTMRSGATTLSAAPAGHRLRQIFKLIPQGPRCMMCAAPFAGACAYAPDRQTGFRQEPDMCHTCFGFMARHHGGAEIECSFLFADVRGSTTIAEGMSATHF